MPIPDADLIASRSRLQSLSQNRQRDEEHSCNEEDRGNALVVQELGQQRSQRQRQVDRPHQARRPDPKPTLAL